jgi:hypothetical protein
MTLGFGNCPSFKDHSLSRRAQTLALKLATCSSLYATHQQRAVGADVQRERRQLVAVQAEEELERVREEHLDGGVQQRHAQQLALGVEAHRQDVLRHLHHPRGGTHVDESTHSSHRQLPTQ